MSLLWISLLIESPTFNPEMVPPELANVPEGFESITGGWLDK